VENSPGDSTQPRPAGIRGQPQASPHFVRVAAVLVLIPALPMLLGSIGALALFYIAPARLEGVITRLPGEGVIRTILFFAPATLFAVVVLAILYALDKPVTPQVQPLPTQRMPGSTWVLAVTVPALLLAVAAWAARFIAPGRFGRLLEALPGTSYLQQAITLAPFVLFPIVVATLFATLVAMARGPKVGTQPEKVVSRGSVPWGSVSANLARLGVRLVLLSSVPMLFLSLAGLGLYYLSPERLESLVTRLSQATVIRLGLIFAPLALLTVVLLAGLFLAAYPRKIRAAATTPSETRPSETTSTRQALAVGTLVGGLVLTVVVGLGLLAAIVWLLIR
jgi:hypothetical protein